MTFTWNPWTCPDLSFFPGLFIGTMLGFAIFFVWDLVAHVRRHVRR